MHQNGAWSIFNFTIRNLDSNYCPTFSQWHATDPSIVKPVSSWDMYAPADIVKDETRLIPIPISTQAAWCMPDNWNATTPSWTTYPVAVETHHDHQLSICHGTAHGSLVLPGPAVVCYNLFPLSIHTVFSSFCPKLHSHISPSNYVMVVCVSCCPGSGPLTVSMLDWCGFHTAPSSASLSINNSGQSFFKLQCHHHIIWNQHKNTQQSILPTFWQ